MPRVHELFAEIVKFKKSLPKAMSSKRDRVLNYKRVQAQIERIGDLLNDEETKKDVNQLLARVREEVEKPAALKSAQELVMADQAKFLRAENTLHSLTGLKDRDYEGAVKKINELFPETDISDFPKTAEEFREEFSKAANSLIEAALKSAELPRREKDLAKSDIREQHWRYCVGTIMTLGNVAGFLFTAAAVPAAAVGGAAIGVASCKYGVALFGLSRSPAVRKPNKSDKSDNSTSIKPRKTG